MAEVAAFHDSRLDAALTAILRLDNYPAPRSIWTIPSAFKPTLTGVRLSTRASVTIAGSLCLSLLAIAAILLHDGSSGDNRNTSEPLTKLHTDTPPGPVGAEPQKVEVVTIPKAGILEEPADLEIDGRKALGRNTMHRDVDMLPALDRLLARGASTPSQRIEALTAKALKVEEIEPPALKSVSPGSNLEAPPATPRAADASVAVTSELNSAPYPQAAINNALERRESVRAIRNLRRQ